MSNDNPPPVTSLHRARILDLWDAQMDTSDIALNVFGERQREAEVYNELARMSGDTRQPRKAPRRTA